VTDTDRAHVRLAELVAALSLGIDLGFGQPMEHVLRQCLIALRLAERIGLDEQTRAVVYYTALLVNVGCHSDAHEQAKWFGDDIALKSGKYDHDDLPSRRDRAVAGRAARAAGRGARRAGWRIRDVGWTRLAGQPQGRAGARGVAAGDAGPLGAGE
jgi:hypothetical protein